MKNEENIRIMLAIERETLRAGVDDFQAALIEERISILNWVLSNDAEQHKDKFVFV